MTADNIGSSPSTNRWVEHIFNIIAKNKMPEPTEYYCGREEDAGYYYGSFYHAEKEGALPTDGHRAADSNFIRRLNIIPIPPKQILPGTEVRRMLADGNNDWREYVPEENRAMVEAKFPEEFKNAAS